MQNPHTLRLNVDQDVWQAIRDWSEAEQRSTGLIASLLVKYALTKTGHLPPGRDQAMTVVDLHNAIRSETSRPCKGSVAAVVNDVPMSAEEGRRAAAEGMRQFLREPSPLPRHRPC